MPNYKLTVAYDGSAYCGYQKQKGRGLPTVQEALESGLSKLAGTQVKVVGAGRTDAGVHARGQVVNFRPVKWAVPENRIVVALNSLLPQDVAAIEAQEVPQQFHAQRDARVKTYSYTIYNRAVPSPFWRLYSLWVPQAVNINLMQQAAAFFQGQHDFASFQAAGRPVKSTVRTIYALDIEYDSPLIRIVVRGDGFLYKMVRTIVGTLLKVGSVHLAPAKIPQIIASRTRHSAGPTAPSQGLCLEKVEY